MSLELSLVVERGGLHLEAQMAAGDGEVVAVVGPNGAGKTTLLRAVAGLERLTAGRVLLDGATLEDHDRRRWVPPESRPVAVVFQEARLLPHLSARDNVAFGLLCRGVRRPKAASTAEQWLQRVGAVECRARRPRSLSGGQAQRVSLARALATEPRLLLLDEPLGGVDTPAKPGLRRLLAEALAEREGSAVLVTHDPVEAATLGHRMVVLEEGRITQRGTVGEVTARPRSQWIADMVGVNLYRGRCHLGRLDVQGGGWLDVAGAPGLHGDAFAVVHPRAVVVHRGEPEGSARNAWRGTVDGIDAGEGRVRVEVTRTPGDGRTQQGGVRSIVAEVTPAAVAALRLAEGGMVWVSVKASEVAPYPA